MESQKLMVLDSELVNGSYVVDIPSGKLI